MMSDDTSLLISAICGALRDLVTLEQFKKREKQPSRSVNFTTPWVFFAFFKLDK